MYALLAQHDLGCWAISSHLVGQATCDNIDERHQCILPAHCDGGSNSSCGTAREGVLC